MQQGVHKILYTSVTKMLDHNKDISLYFKEEIVSAEKKGMAEKGCYYKKYGGEHGRIKEWEYNQMCLP